MSKTNTNPTTTALGGTLIFDGNAYRWSDGTPEPRVSPLTASQHYNFRCRTYGEGGCFVEVPLSAAQSNENLRWIWDGRANYQQSLSGDHTGMKMLVIGQSYAEGDTPGVSQPDTTVTAIPTRADGGKRAIPRVLLVPVQQWDEWSNANPIGVHWPKEFEGEILAKARSLGWNA